MYLTKYQKTINQKRLSVPSRLPMINESSTKSKSDERLLIKQYFVNVKPYDR